MSEKKNVCRCPVCGSTKAHYDHARSKPNRTFMTCPACGHEGLYEAWEVTRDWFVEIDLAEGAAVPDKLPPQTSAERSAAEAKAKWLVMAHDSYAREDRVVAELDSEISAHRRLKELQAAKPDGDHMWIVKAEP